MLVSKPAISSRKIGGATVERLGDGCADWFPLFLNGGAAAARFFSSLMVTRYSRGSPSCDVLLCAEVELLYRRASLREVLPVLHVSLSLNAMYADQHR